MAVTLNASSTAGFVTTADTSTILQLQTNGTTAVTVDADGNPQYQGVDTSFLVATLTAAIQEQQAIIESLKARLDAANL